MSVIIGIDVGGSTTKIVGFRKNSERDCYDLITPQFVRADDQITSAYGAFGKFTDDHAISLKEIDRVMITGVGASFIKRDLYGLECSHVPEFTSIGRGGLYISGLSEALVVSMGTGTALVHARKDGKMRYLGGTGIGGGTLMGLSHLLLKADSVEHITEMAEGGDLSRIDLRISDITPKGEEAALASDLTASNFGNVSDIATKADIAAGILNAVLETVGMVSVFAARSVGAKNVVLTGSLTRISVCPGKFKQFNEMYAADGMKFSIPSLSEFATVIGTALCGLSPKGHGSALAPHATDLRKRERQVPLS